MLVDKLSIAILIAINIFIGFYLKSLSTKIVSMIAISLSFIYMQWEWVYIVYVS